MVGILPNLRASSLFQSKKKYEKIRNKSYYINYFDSARSSLFVYLENLKLSKGSKVLIPSFICDSIIQTLINFEYEIVFYEINENFLPKINFIDDDIEVLIIVNFFGLYNEKNIVSRIKKKNNVKIIYDCAHSVPNYHKYNYMSDAIIFSLYKAIPVIDGGILLSLSNIKADNISEFKKFNLIIKTFKKLISYFDSFLPFSIILYFLSNEKIFKRVYENNVVKFSLPKKISNISFWYLSKFSYDEEAIKRTKNYELLYQYFISKKINEIEKIYKISDESRPLFFPMLMKNKLSCKSFSRKLKKINISPGIFWPKPSLTNNSHDYYERLIVLPLHDDKCIVKVLKSF